jgi:hypothetical protein
LPVIAGVRLTSNLLRYTIEFDRCGCAIASTPIPAQGSNALTRGKVGQLRFDSVAQKAAYAAESLV